MSIGGVMGDTDLENVKWKKHINALIKEVEKASEGVDSRLRINVVFHVDGKIAPNEFTGIRTSRFSKKESELMMQAAVPKSIVGNYDEHLLNLLKRAIDEAEIYAIKKKIAQGLPEIRAIVSDLEINGNS